MNIGDKVRLLHSREEGIISRIVSATIVEIEIEEGFSIPVKRSEVVLIAKEEALRFGEKSNTLLRPETNRDKPTPKAFAQQGLYVAFIAVNDRIYTLHFINNTDYELPFVIALEKSGQHQHLSGGSLASRNAVKVTEVNIQDFENWGVFIFQCLFFHYSRPEIREPFIKRIRFRAATFFKSKKNAPVLDKEAFVFQIDQEQTSFSPEPENQKMESIDPIKLKEQMYENAERNRPEKRAPIKAPKLEVDLHIEALTKDYARLNAAEMLETQLWAFTQNLESAIASGMDEITFIHGVGNGTLRQEIHRRLAGHAEIKYFQDAKKEKFGYGATSVKFK
ncbi:MAG: Smr/MutS family protein [Bacteroidia bacterium]|nr:Smr/MutS family protein [Bacteroidia bacterium]